jgi:hypothetical protein
MASKLDARLRARLAPWIAFPAVFGLLVLAGIRARAADVPGAGTQTVPLEYQESGSRIKGWRLRITPQAQPFKQEPDWGGRHICRGIINSAFQGVEKPGEPPGHTINLPFAWDYLRGKLYLDVNRNGDLRGDAVWSTQPSQGDYCYQTFSNMYLTFGGKGQSHPVLVDIALYAYKGKDIRGGNLTWRSFWQGKAVLQGRECQVGLIEHANHLGSTQEGYLLLRPWAEREKPFSLEDGLMTGFDYCPNLFACGQAYRLDCAYRPGDTPKYDLTLTETRVELGEVALTGKFLERVIFRDHRAKVPYTVVLDRPEPKIRIPVGTYHKYWVVLKEKDTVAFCHYRDWLNPRPVTITVSKPTTLAMGGPLTNWVAAASHDFTLAFDYELRGAGGRYRLAGPVDQSHPPELAIYQNGKQVGGGRFQYG